MVFRRFYACFLPVALMAVSGCSMTPHRSYVVRGTVSIEPVIAGQVPVPAYLCVGELNPRNGRLHHGALVQLEGRSGEVGPALLVCEVPPVLTSRRFEWHAYGAFELEEVQLVAWLESAPAMTERCSPPERLLRDPSQARSLRKCDDFQPTRPHGRARAFPRDALAEPPRSRETRSYDDAAITIRSSP
jgi:hypothetical protein